MNKGKMLFIWKIAPPIMNPMADQRTKPRVIVCLRPILSMSRPPMKQPGRKNALIAVPEPIVCTSFPFGLRPEMIVELYMPKGYTWMATQVSEMQRSPY